MKVLITAGSTREPIDAVRHVSNISTGKLGIEIAKESLKRGHVTLLLYGFGALKPPSYINTKKFATTKDLYDLVINEIKNFDVFISVAAVSDYTPIFIDEKIDSDKNELIIKLKPTPKVLKEAKKIANKNTLFVAFKLGYMLDENELIKKAIESYGEIADIIIVNDLLNINDRKHLATILYKNKILYKAKTKKEIAKLLFNTIETKTIFLKIL